MQIIPAQWGNSLGLRVPKEIARQAGLRKGEPVEITLEEGRIIVARKKPRYTLEGLVADLDPVALREAWDWGPDVGREIIDE